MIPGSFLPGPGCTVLGVTSAFEQVDDTLSEDLVVEIESDGGCQRLVFGLPGGATLSPVKVVERRADGTRVKLDETRWALGVRDPDADTTTTLHVPDLWKRDRLEVHVRREGLPPSFAAAFPPGAPLDRPWVGPDPLPAAVLGPRSRTVVLELPPGDPQVALHPEGDARSRVEERVTASPGEGDRAFTVDAPPGARVELRVEPSGGARLEPAGAVWRVRVHASEAPTRMILSWTDPACPTHGEVGDLAELSVTVDGGQIRWEGDRWSLARVGDRWILPDRDVLVAALDRRFRASALPEPGLPMELRGAPASADILGLLRPTLATRAPVLEFTTADPLFPRPLAGARKSGALTPTEATLVLWLYATQLRMDARWALARPAPTETLPADAPPPVSPAGYTHPLLVVTLADGVQRWIDPTCTSCAPFELPPDLEGARVISPGGPVSTPPPRVGALRVDIGADAVTYTAEGPAALAVRLALHDLPEEVRGSALATLVGGAGATLRTIEGLADAGAPLVVVTTRGEGLVPDPTAVPAPGADGSVWFPWIGPRTVTVDGAGPPVDLDTPAAHLSVTAADGRTTRVLEVRRRAVDPVDAAALEAALAPPPPAPPVEGPPAETLPGDAAPVSRPAPAPDPPSPPSAPSSR